MTEKLTACKDCVWWRVGANDLHLCVCPDLKTFNAFSGTWYDADHPQFARNINTGKEACPHFEAKP